MPRDLPDWGAPPGPKTIFEVTDLGEVTVRLGSIITFDRGGDVVWFDDFENGIGKWETELSGSGAAIDLALGRSRNGLYAARLVAGSDASELARIIKVLPSPDTDSLGIEYSFQFAQAGDQLDLTLRLYDGTNLTEYGIFFV